MTDQPIALFWEDDVFLFVRFERVGSEYFRQALMYFKQQIPSAVWQPDERVWKLPKTEMQKLAVFAYEAFGRDSLQWQGSMAGSHLETPRQT